MAPHASNGTFLASDATTAPLAHAGVRLPHASNGTLLASDARTAPLAHHLEVTRR